jgi:hypothetical protein
MPIFGSQLAEAALRCAAYSRQPKSLPLISNESITSPNKPYIVSAASRHDGGKDILLMQALIEQCMAHKSRNPDGCARD